jgi:predicted negative regulator of RcsB-dependent stress response
MADHYEEEAQVVELKKWLNDNWKSLATGLALGIAVVVGYTQYQQYQERQKTNAASLYGDFKKQSIGSNRAEAEILAVKLTSQYPQSPYAVGVQFELALLDTEKRDWAAAQKRLDWVLTHSKDAAIVDIAKLRKGQLLWQQGQVEQARLLLDEVKGAYKPVADELRGDIFLAKGDRKAAHAAYKQAFEGSKNASGALTSKLEDLADIAPVPTVPVAGSAAAPASTSVKAG